MTFTFPKRRTERVQFTVTVALDYETPQGRRDALAEARENVMGISTLTSEGGARPVKCVLETKGRTLIARVRYLRKLYAELDALDQKEAKRGVTSRYGIASKHLKAAVPSMIDGYERSLLP